MRDLSWLTAVGDWVLGDPQVIDRDREVTAILERIGRELAPVSPLICGRSGSGRTSTIHALAHLLDSAGYSGPLASTPVFRVAAHKLVEHGASATLRRVADALGEDAVLIVDDLEVAASLTRVDADDSFLRTVRSIVEEQAPRTVLVMDERYLAAFAVHAPELRDEVERVPHPVLSKTSLRTVVTRIASRIGPAHGLDVDEKAIDAALRPGRSTETAHPTLAMHRLDQAAVRARLDGRCTVVGSDVRTTNVVVGPVASRELAERISARVLGQDHVVRRIARRLSLTRAAFDLRPGRPDGVFLLIGPTGTGKTELAHAVSEALSGRDDAIIRLDMGEYSQEWSQSALIGPPPGYSGSSDPAAWLTTRLLARPDAVVLLDEFEKAHRSIWNTFLHVFDEGRLTDSLGRTADCSKCVFMLTSNLGADELTRARTGFDVPRPGDSSGSPGGDLANRARTAVRAALPAELFNRFDEVLVLRPLDVETVTAIARVQVGRLVEHHRTRGFQLTIDDEVIHHLAVTAFDPSLGARHLQRNLEALLIEPLLDVEGLDLIATIDRCGSSPQVRWRRVED